MKTQTMTKKQFIDWAAKSFHICIPIKTGKNSWEFVSVDKDALIKELSTSKRIKKIEFDQTRDEPDSTIWLHTPEYPNG